MKSEHLKNITPEQRTAILEQARIARAEKAKWAKENLKLDWMDDAHWRELASKYNTRLPNKTAPNTEVKYLKRLFKSVGIDYKEYLDACGVTTLKQLVSLNPHMPAFAEVGFALEWIDSRE